MKTIEIVALDCEMVGVGQYGEENMLARVALVDISGNCIYDKFVKPTREIVDYRTAFSGVRPADLENADEFEKVQREVADIIRGKILVGHDLTKDFQVLGLTHPRRDLRDTSKYTLFRSANYGRTPSLKLLARHFLGEEIQTGEHSPVQDAKTAMQLYYLTSKGWELSLGNMTF